MLGEELNSSYVTERGLVGDRAYALIDQETGKVASAKNPRKWGKLFDFRAAFIEDTPPQVAKNILVYLWLCVFYKGSTKVKELPPFPRVLGTSNLTSFLVD